MKTTILLGLFAVLATAPAAASAASKTYDLPPFSKIEVASGIGAVVTIGTPQSVMAESPNADDLDEVVVEVIGDTLRLKREWDFFDIFDLGQRETKFTITVPAITGVESSSGSAVEVTGISGNVVGVEASSGSSLTIHGATGVNYDVEVSSGSNVTIEGTCQSATVEASSGANVRADQLLCNDMTVGASSGANALVFASIRLKAEASSGATVSVRGNPTATEVESSSGARIDIGS